MEFLSLLLLLSSALLLLKAPHRERLAFGLLVASALLMVAIFSLGVRTALLPGVNY